MNPDLANILGRTNSSFDNYHFGTVLDSRFLGSQISKFPDSQISRFPDFQVPRFQDAGSAGAGRTLRSQTNSSPNAARDQIRRKESLLRPFIDATKVVMLLDPRSAESDNFSQLLRRQAPLPEAISWRTSQQCYKVTNAYSQHSTRRPPNLFTGNLLYLPKNLANGKPLV